MGRFRYDFRDPFRSLKCSRASIVVGMNSATAMKHILIVLMQNAYDGQQKMARPVLLS